jgi:hypothetical protein
MKMTTMIRSFGPMLCAVIILFFCGCLPIPHTTPRSADVRGRVLDANTRLPIKGAKVFLVEEPHHTTCTDEGGYFHMKATRNFHLAYTGGSGWPDSKDNYVQISMTNYVPYGFDDYGGGNLGDILLKPQK